MGVFLKYPLSLFGIELRILWKITDKKQNFDATFVNSSYDKKKFFAKF